MRVAIIGAGISGLSCAAFLRDDAQVVVFDEGRAPGGRTTTKKVGTARYDTGAPWFEAKTDAFKTALAGWQQRGVAAKFEPQWAPGSVVPEGEVWVGTPGMNAIARELAGDVELKWGTPVTRISREAEGFKLFGRSEELGTFERVVVAAGFSDAKALVSASKWDAAAFVNVKSAAVWAVSCEFSAPSVVPWNAGSWREGPLRFAVRESAKPDREPGAYWMAYASPEWSAEHVTSKASDVAAEIGAALAERLGVAAAPSARAWNWTDAVVLQNAGKATIEIDDVFFCGDWCAGGGVEAAWKSGVLTANRLVRGT